MLYFQYYPFKNQDRNNPISNFQGHWRRILAHGLTGQYWIFGWSSEASDDQHIPIIEQPDKPLYIGRNPAKGNDNHRNRNDHYDQHRSGAGLNHSADVFHWKLHAVVILVLPVQRLVQKQLQFRPKVMKVEMSELLIYYVLLLWCVNFCKKNIEPHMFYLWMHWFN